jgi:hypothetical protein
MPIKRLTALFTALLMLGGCAQNDTAQYSAPEEGDSAFLKGVDTREDKLYLTAEVQPGGRDFRDVYIAPADLSLVQVIQPEGAPVDEEWHVNDSEKSILQKTINAEFAIALSYDSAFNIVDNQDEAEMVVNTTIVAIHPNQTKAAVAAGAKPGGSITISLALVNEESGNVMVRSVDTKSSDNIWAFHQVDNDNTAVALIFKAWGNSMRRGILQLQGRSSDPLATPILVEPQK